MKRIYLLIPAIILAAALVAVSINRSKHLKERSDYNVFYQAGRHFSQDLDLYDRTDNMRNFYYPPFAAFIFQALTVVPFRISANIFFLINVLVLFPLAVWMLFSILENLGYDRRKVRWPVILATVASLRFFWNNLNMFQMNFVVFTIILAGILYMSRKKPSVAAVLFTLATFIKVYPVFFVFYIFAVKRTKAVFLAIAVTGIFCIVAPSVQRGLTAGVKDHITYYKTFLTEFGEGKVVDIGMNHTLRAFMLKAFAPETRDRDVYLDDYPGISTISRLALLALFVGLAAALVIQIRRGEGVLSVPFVACLFIFTHLFSGITWTAHLVTSMFYYLPLFLIDYRKLKTPVRVFHFVLIFLVFFLAVEGSDTTGKMIYTFIRTYDLFVVVPLLLFGYYIAGMILGRQRIIVDLVSEEDTDLTDSMHRTISRILKNDLVVSDNRW